MNWTFDRDSEWENDFPKQCADKKKQSPINIDTSLIDSTDPIRKINMCDIDCKLSVKYNPSTCHIINEFNTPTIYFDSGSFIGYNGHMEMKNMILTVIIF